MRQEGGGRFCVQGIAQALHRSLQGVIGTAQGCVMYQVLVLGYIPVYTLGYPGTKPSCLGDSRIGTRYPQSMCSGLPGYRTLLFWPFSGRYLGTSRVYVSSGYPGTEPRCFGHSRLGNRAPPECILWVTPVPILVVLVILGEVPGHLQGVFSGLRRYRTSLFW